MTYTFNQQSFIFAYSQTNVLVGMFLIKQGTESTKEDLFEYFDEHAEFLVTVPTPPEIEILDDEAGEEEMITCLVRSSELIDIAEEGLIDKLPAGFVIVRTLH